MMGIFRPDVGAACGKHYKKLLKIKATCREILEEWEEKGEEAWRYHRLLDPTEMTRYASSSRTDGYRDGARDGMNTNTCIVEATATEYRGLGGVSRRTRRTRRGRGRLGPGCTAEGVDTQRSHDAPCERPQSVSWQLLSSATG